MDPELREASASAASKLRPMMCGSSALPYPVMQQWETITKHHLLERYVCDGNFYSLERHKERKHCWQTSSRIPYCRTQHGGNCMEKGATIPPNKETKLPCCSSLYRGPHISEEMGFLKVGAHKRYLRQCSVASEEQKKGLWDTINQSHTITQEIYVVRQLPTTTGVISIIELSRREIITHTSWFHPHHVDSGLLTMWVVAGANTFRGYDCT
ncbi:uncharacterized protein LOC114266946 isoform X3 [Camellia sinensis]|nr:uncharacterized protein LOC114266946 isoform X3 [Camellia sinensis]XP_028063761.1 uncharacterized protein LOC114266946 isoform X3 [Camellia sinensis]